MRNLPRRGKPGKQAGTVAGVTNDARDRVTTLARILTSGSNKKNLPTRGNRVVRRRLVSAPLQDGPQSAFTLPESPPTD